MNPSDARRRPPKLRGFSTLEAMISMALMLIGMVGILGAQIVSARSNGFTKHMSYGIALLRDLEENMPLWVYTDSRIAPAVSSGNTISSVSNSTLVAPRWDTGRTAAPQACGTGSCTSYTPDFTDQSSGATTNNALSASTLMSNDLDGDGIADFQRFWNVYYLNTGSGVSGKLIQIFVRWKEPGLGYRSISTLTFRSDPAVVAL